MYEPLAQGTGKELKTYQPQQQLPLVSAGAYQLKSYEKKGTTVFTADPNYWGPKSNAEAVALTYYTNADAMITDLKGGQLDWVDQVPFSAVDAVKEDSSLAVVTRPGAETTNITWNSNPRKPMNRELLDPQVKEALSMCVDRDKITEVVFFGYSENVESLVGHISPLENPNLGPLEHDCAAGNQILDDLVAVCAPRRMTVEGDFSVRGGIKPGDPLTVTAFVARNGSTTGLLRSITFPDGRTFTRGVYGEADLAR